MLSTTKNWTLDTYVDDTWTTLVAEASVLATVTLCNTGTTDVVVSMRVDDGATELARIVSLAVVAQDESFTLDFRSLAITDSQRLQIHCDVSGIHFLASGAV